MLKQNPFPYSDDHKRYHTWNYYLKQTYHNKVFKTALNAGFTCPNRDGTSGIGGCIFCSSLGSGDFAGNARDDLMIQFDEQLMLMRRKWPHGKAMPYFQAFSNTYAPLSVLKDTFAPFISRDDIIGLCIATRADCLEDEKLQYLDQLCSNHDIWIEIGLQSVHDITAKYLNRGHDYATFLDCIQRLSKTKCHICVHIINSLPYETKEMMLETAASIAKLPIHAVKIHMLHILKGTRLADEFQLQPFPLLSKDEYIDIVIDQLELLPNDIIIQRLTGDGDKAMLLAPKWTTNKLMVLNDIDKAMLKRDTWQGKNVK